MTIRNRLQLISLIPILLLFLVAVYFLITSYINYEKTLAFKHKLENNALFSETLIKIGKERSATALYLGSHKQKYLSSLTKQRKLLDENYQVLERKFQKKIPAYILLQFIDPNLEKIFKEDESILKNLALLPSIRKTVDSKQVNFKKIFFEQYTNLLTSPTVKSINTLHYNTINPEITSLVSTLLALSNSQEYSDLERGFVAYYLEQKSPMPFDDVILWDTFVSKSNSYDITKISPISLKEQLGKILENSTAQTLFKDIIHSRISIKQNISDGKYSQSTIDWFSLQNNKIALLSKAQILISNTLLTKINTLLEKELMLLILFALLLLFTILLAYLGHTTQKDITHNIYTLEHMLNDTAYKMRNEDSSLNSALEKIKNIKLHTKEGTKEAYKFLQILIDKVNLDKHVVATENKATSHFLANKSHKIYTPLTGILESTQMLRNTNLNNEQSEFVSIIDKNSESLSHIINNILDVSKIENHKIEVENIVFDASKAFENTIETYAVDAAKKNIDLHYYMDPRISSNLRGDPNKIKEVLTNLLSNAIKFTMQGGEINLDITKDEPNYITFTIKDNGIGIPKDKQTHIFNAFSQEDTSVTRKYGGTDLGLTISSKFVEIMNGILSVDSSHKEGTTFSFTLPLEEIFTEEITKKDNYSNHTIALYTKDISTKFKFNLEHYFEYFKSHTKEFESQKELQVLKDSQECQSYWIDIDKADKDILNCIQDIDITKLFILANLTSKERIRELGLQNNNIVYKPLTLTKIQKILTKVKESIEIQSVKYSADTMDKKENTHLELLDLDLPTDSIKMQKTLLPKVLIAKHFLLERRILIKVIENLGLAYEILTDESLETALKEEKYDIVFTDEKYITEDISGHYPDISIITDSKTKDEIITLVSEKRI